MVVHYTDGWNHCILPFIFLKQIMINFFWSLSFIYSTSLTEQIIQLILIILVGTDWNYFDFPRTFLIESTSYVNLVRSCLFQMLSWLLVSVLACVKCTCWKCPFLRHRSTAFLQSSSIGALDSAPISFSSISAVTSSPIVWIDIHKM